MPASRQLPPLAPGARPAMDVGFVGWLYLGIGPFLLVVSAYLVWHESAFLARAEHARGLVVALTERHSASSLHRNRAATYAPTFTFVDRAGQEHRVFSDTSSNPPAYRVGENVDVLYLPDRPDQAQLRGFFIQWGSAAICGGLCGMYFLIGAPVAKALCRTYR